MIIENVRAVLEAVRTEVIDRICFVIVKMIDSFLDFSRGYSLYINKVILANSIIDL